MTIYPKWMYRKNKHTLLSNKSQILIFTSSHIVVSRIVGWWQCKLQQQKNTFPECDYVYSLWKKMSGLCKWPHLHFKWNYVFHMWNYWEVFVSKICVGFPRGTNNVISKPYTYMLGKHRLWNYFQFWWRGNNWNIYFFKYVDFRKPA